MTERGGGIQCKAGKRETELERRVGEEDEWQIKGLHHV